MTGQNPRQTISYLSRRLASVGLRPKNRFGQNFLIDLNLIDLLVRAADIQANDVVLEIGTGMGSLTGRLAERAAAVITVEVDRHLNQLAREELEDCGNVRYLVADALQNKHQLNPEIWEMVGAELAADSNRKFKVAANLPYNIATPVLSNLLIGPHIPESMTVTIQKELADRIMASPGTKDFSALSIWMQALCDVELVRALPPSVFWPRPRVSSAIIQIRPQPDKRNQIGHLDFFHQFIRALFFHRRKFLRSAAVSAVGDQLDKSAVDEVLASLDLPSDQRAEQLSVERLLALSEAFADATDGSLTDPSTVARRRQMKSKR